MPTKEKRDGTWMLGSGMAKKAAKKIKGRKSKIDQAVDNATGNNKKKY